MRDANSVPRLLSSRMVCSRMDIKKGFLMEVWDLYDRNRCRLKETMVRGEPVPAGCYHLVVHVCLFNKKGELLIQKRHPDKKGWPGLWDISVGGSAVAGDDSRSAAERETLEEVGIEIDLSEIAPRLTVSGANSIDDYYMVLYDAPLSAFTPQPEEVTELQWVDKKTLMTLVKNGTFVPYFFIDRLFDLYAMQGSIYEAPNAADFF